MTLKIVSVWISFFLLILVLTGCYRTQVFETGIMDKPPVVEAGIMNFQTPPTNIVIPNANMYIYIKGESLQPSFTIKSVIKQNKEIIQNSEEEFVASASEFLTNDTNLQQAIIDAKAKGESQTIHEGSNPQQWQYFVVISKFMDELNYPKGEPLVLELYIQNRLMASHKFVIDTVVNNPVRDISDMKIEPTQTDPVLSPIKEQINTTENQSK